MAKFAYYFSAYRAKTAAAFDSMKLLANSLSKHGSFDAVFRYRYKTEPPLPGVGRTYLYQNLRKLTDAQVSDLENKYLPPYSTIRIMTQVSRNRYPNVSNLPDDYTLAQIADAWVRFFNEKKPDMFVCGLMDDYAGIIGMEVARSMGIRTVLLFFGGLYSCQYLLADNNFLPIFYKDFPEKEIADAYKKARDGIVNRDILNPQQKETFDTMNNLASIWNFFYMVKNFVSSVKGYYFDIPAVERKMWMSPYELTRRQVRYFVRPPIMQFIFNKRPKEGERFVFFPLHFQDDAALIGAVPFVSQVDVIEELAKVMPHGVKLYVKPHPHWKCADMKLSDAQRMSRLRNVVLLRPEINAKDLIRKCEAVVMINSSVGYEALVLKKKIFSLGNFFPPDIIPRISQPRELVKRWGTIPDWKKVERYIGLHYLHGIVAEKEKYTWGALDNMLSEAFADAIWQHYSKKGQK